MGKLYLILSAVALVGSVLVIRILLRPRRRGSTPHCACCDYNLTGLTSDRCPECGTEMTPANIVYGELAGRPWGKALAAVITLALLILAGRWAWSYDWYRVRPNSWVLSDLQSSSLTRRSTAWGEIQRRVKNGSLSGAQHSRLIDICLQRQTAKTPFLMVPDPMIDYLGPCLLGGQMSPAQQATFIQQVIELKLTARSPVTVDQEVPLGIDGTCLSPGGSDIHVRMVGRSEIRIDGAPSTWTMTREVDPIGGYSGRRVSSCTLRRSSSLPRLLPPGQHVLSTIVQLEMVHQPRGVTVPHVLHRWEIPLMAPVEVLAADSPRCLRLIGNPSLRPVLQEAITLIELVKDHYSDGGHEYLEARFEHSAIPVNVSFEVIVKGGGRERRLSAFAIDTLPYSHFPKTVTGDDYSGPLLFNVGDRVDVILRTHKGPALSTTDMFEIWDGELVYPNVRIKSAR